MTDGRLKAWSASSAALPFLPAALAFLMVAGVFLPWAHMDDARTSFTGADVHIHH